LISYLNTGVVPQETIATPTEIAQPSLSFAGVPGLPALFALPDATMQTLEQIPGIDGLIYRLHEAETFPGFKSPSVVLGAAAAFDPGKIAYWAIGNVVGNAKPALVRTTYLGLGMLLFLGLLIAFASAQAEQNMGALEQAAPVVAEALA
jgi:hypothetical protein